MSEFDPYKEWLGIEPHEHPVDFYRLLSVERFETDAHLISVAADQRMNHIRSFQTGPRGKLTQPILNELALARRTLLSETKRQEYDDQLRGDLDLETDIDAHLPPSVAPTIAQGAGLTVEAEMSPTVGIPAPTVDLPASVVGATEPAPTVNMSQDMLPQPIAPPVTNDSPFDVARTPAAKPSVTDRRRGSKSSGMKAFVLLIVGVVVVAGAVWGVGTMRKRRRETAQDNKQAQPRTKPQPTKPKEDGRFGLKPEGKRKAVEVMQEGSGEVNLTPALAGLFGPNIDLKARGELEVIEHWNSQDDWAQWKFRLARPGVFQLRLTYQVANNSGGSYEILLDGESVKEAGTRSGGGPNFITDEYHLAVKRSGSHVLSLKPSSEPRSALMVLKSIKLVPRTREIN